MKTACIPTLCVFLLAAALAAEAADIRPDPSFSLTVPDGWETLQGSVRQAPESVKAAIGCADEDPGEIKVLGWELAEDGRFHGAYCISYQRRGMGRLRDILNDPNPDKAKEAGDKLIDSFASKLNDEYSRKRNMTVSDLSADLIKADGDVIMVMDGLVTGSGVQYMRGTVVYLHDDALLNISSIYDKRAPETVRRALDAIPVSLRWH